MRLPRHTQHGFTLLEVLVALVILSIGLIGLAGLQSASLKQNYNAYLRSQATAMAYNMADRIRSNRLGADNGNYNGIDGTQNTACEGTGGCSEAEMAAHDVYLWKEGLASRLPLGGGSVCIDSTPSTTGCDNTGPTHVVRVFWDDNRDNDTDDAGETVVLAFVP